MKIKIQMSIAFLLALATTNGVAKGSIVISEWAYQGNNGEFVEFTNIGPSPVDMTGWSYSDEGRTPGAVSLSAFGVVPVGQSVILTETGDAAFRTAWSLSASIPVIGSNLTQNLGRNDEINLYDNTNTLIDRLNFGDQEQPGTIRTQNITGNPISAAAFPDDNASQWVLSGNGDSYGSHLSTGGDIGNPGVYAVPEPATLAMLMIGGMLLMRRRS